MKCQVGGFCHRSIITYKEVVSPPICLILKKLTFPAAINETRIVAYHKIAYTYIKHWKCQGHCKNVDFPRSVLKNNFSPTYTFARYCFEWKTAPLSATIVLHETLDSMRKSITVLSATKNILFYMTISTGCFRTNVFSSISITHAYYVFFNFQPSRRQNSMAAN